MAGAEAAKDSRQKEAEAVVASWRMLGCDLLCKPQARGARLISEASFAGNRIPCPYPLSLSPVPEEQTNRQYQ